MPALTHKPIGILDIGSNSVRLVVYEPPYLGEYPAFNEKVQCSLGADLVATGKLHPPGKTCTIDALLGFKSLAKAMGLDMEHVYVIGTAAIRDATDGPAFVKVIRDQTGFEVQVVDGQQEARYAALGVLTAFPHAKGIIGDMGGGSLELARIYKREVLHPLSLPLGALRIMAQEKPKPFIDSHLKTLDKTLLSDKLFYAVGGTWRTIAYLHQIHRNKKTYNLENYRVAAKDRSEFARLVSKMSGETLMTDYHIEHRRADLVPYSALMLARLLKKLNSKTVIFTNTSVREGKLVEILENSKPA